MNEMEQKAYNQGWENGREGDEGQDGIPWQTGTHGTPGPAGGTNPLPVAGMRPYFTRESMLLEQVDLLARQARELEPWPNMMKVCDALELAQVWLRAATGRI